MSAHITAQLRARGAALAAAASVRLRGRVAASWGAADTGDDGVRLAAADAARRRGTRRTLADPKLLWPGDK